MQLMDQFMECDTHYIIFLLIKLTKLSVNVFNNYVKSRNKAISNYSKLIYDYFGRLKTKCDRDILINLSIR